MSYKIIDDLMANPVLHNNPQPSLTKYLPSYQPFIAFKTTAKSTKMFA